MRYWYYHVKTLRRFPSGSYSIAEGFFTSLLRRIRPKGRVCTIMNKSDSGSSHGVNNILHNLRGEQFRRLQNLKHSRSHLSAARNVRAPTLPPGTVDYGQDPVPASNRVDNLVSWSGPAPPKSWRSPLQTRDRDTPQWRAEALDIVTLRLGNPVNSSVPPLSLLCLQIVLSSCVDSKEFREQMVPFIPAHLRRDLIRHCAIHSPLPAWKLDILLVPDGHVEGEIMVVGRTAFLQRDHLQRIADTSLHNQSTVTDWELDNQTFRPLHTLVFLSSSLAHSVLLAIPSTLTDLALIDVSSPQPLHRLPKLCPLLVLLDLSYNSWLNDPSLEGYGSFERIDWLRWGRLKTLGLRECYATQELLQRIEEGKWGDLSIIR